MAPGSSPRGTESLAKIEAFAGEIERFIRSTPDHHEGRSVALSSLAGLQALAESLEHLRLAALITLNNTADRDPSAQFLHQQWVKADDERIRLTHEVSGLQEDIQHYMSRARTLVIQDGIVLGLDSIDVILATLSESQNRNVGYLGKEQADLYAQLSEARAEILAAQKRESPS